MELNQELAHCERHPVLPGTLLCGLLLIAGFLAFTPPGVHAQVLYGSIVGIVEDQTGAVVPNAVVSIISGATGQTREMKANETGRYSFPNVLLGSYSLKVTASGFRPYTETNVIATINTVTRIDIKLLVGTAVEEITVAASAALLQTDKADVHVELNTKEITNLPLSNFRNYQSLINLVPGATPGTFQNSVQGAPGRALSTNINGTNRNNNITRLDGAVNLYLWLPHHTAYVAPSETIETVNIATDNFDAELLLGGHSGV